ncbi:unnamed protein product [Cylicocyclus nassatus]|uniref:Uncharacterized protein n=1 Tax=Cylicocyclus nassatus TaxID=53992 RepID=A0AA36H6G3_CYLNA|nr:unnamed protein product [Cylicocyclus nassatus]
MKKFIKWAIGGAILIIVIVGVIIAVVLKKKYGSRDPIMCFAIHVGDRARLYDLGLTHAGKLQEEDCSLEKNKRNIREAILAMDDVKQLYAFIFYSDIVNVTSSQNSAEALEILDSVKSRAGSSYRQESVAKEYISQRSKKDLLVYFIPCDFTYREGDDDMGKFVTELKSAGVNDKVLIVSNTRPSRDVADLYALSDSNVVGEEHDIAGRISDFGHSIVSTRPTRKPRPSTSVTSGPPTVPPEPYKCLFVGDLYNFGNNANFYLDEAQFIGEFAYDLFLDKRTVPSGALWAYGYSNFSQTPDLEKMYTNYTAFLKDLKNMKYFPVQDPMNTACAIEVINNLPKDDERVNCIVFISAENSTTLPKLDPQNEEIKRIVGIGFAGTNLSSVVGQKGVALTVPYYYLDEDLRDVHEAILGRYPTTTTKTTKRLTTVTPKPTIPVPLDEYKCLFIDDLYNFGSKNEFYEDEAEFIAEVGYDIFAAKSNVATGIWAYGYTRFPRAPSLDRMCTNYNDLLQEIKSLQYSPIQNPINTARAIEVINSLGNDERVNCLVFFSAENNTMLPKLNPQNKEIKRVVGVGFAGTDLRSVVGQSGVAVSVPYYYLNENVEEVVEAIIGRW